MEEIKDFVICLFDTGLQLVPKSWFVPNSLENVMFPSYKTKLNESCKKQGNSTRQFAMGHPPSAARHGI